jgi:hypothetical protein
MFCDATRLSRVLRTVTGLERVADLRLQIDYLASTVALLPVSPRRAAARAAVQAIERDIAELLRHLGVDDPTT